MAKCYGEEKCALRGATQAAKLQAKWAALQAASLPPGSSSGDAPPPPTERKAAAFLAARFGSVGVAVGRAELENSARHAGIGWRTIGARQGSLRHPHQG